MGVPSVRKLLVALTPVHPVPCPLQSAHCPPSRAGYSLLIFFHTERGPERSCFTQEIEFLDPRRLLISILPASPPVDPGTSTSLPLWTADPTEAAEAHTDRDTPSPPSLLW